MARRIACAAYGGGHVRAVMPVVEALRARGDAVCMLGLTTAAHDLRQAGIDHLTAADLLDRAGDHAIRETGARLAAAVPANAKVDARDTAAYLGLGYHDLIDRHGEAQGERMYRAEGRKAFDHQLLARRFLDRAQADLVLVTNAPRAERAIMHEARVRGDKRVVIVDLFAPSTEPWLFEHGYADRFCVINDYVAQRLIAGGQPAHAIAITGNPAFNALFGAKRAPRDEGARARVLFVSQELSDADRLHREQMRAELIRIATIRSDWEVRVRFYPNETQTDWAHPPLRHSPRDTSVMEDLAHADVVITHGSTVGIEAAIMGIPVVQPVGSDMAGRAPFHLAGLSIPVADITGVEGAITHAIGRPPPDHGIPADAVPRILAAVDELRR